MSGSTRVKAHCRLRELRVNLPGAAYGIQALAFAPDGGSFCTPGGRNEVIAWRVSSGGHETLPCKEVLPANTTNGQTEVAPFGQTGAVKAVSVSKDGKKVAMGSAAGVVVWGGKGQPLLVVANKPSAPVNMMTITDRLWFGGHYAFGCFSPDGKVVAVVTSDAPKAIRLFDLDTGRQLRRIALKGNLVRLAFSPDGERIASTEHEVAVRLYEAKSGKQVWSRELQPAKNAENYTSAVAYSPDGKIIAAGTPVGPDNDIYLLDAATGDIVGKLSGHTWKPWALAFTADGKMLYSAGWDKFVRFWDANTGKMLSAFDTGKAINKTNDEETEGGWVVLNRVGGPSDVRMYTVCYSPAGGLIATAHMDGRVRIWQAEKMELLRAIDVGGFVYGSMSYSPDGLWLATGTADGQISLWDPLTARLVAIDLGQKSPFRVSVDPRDSSVWVANFRKSVERFSADGKPQAEYAIEALAVQVDLAESNAWVVTPTEVQEINRNGIVIKRMSHAAKTSQAWIKALEEGSTRIALPNEGDALAWHFGVVAGVIIGRQAWSIAR